jgi:hypothetical protein
MAIPVPTEASELAEFLPGFFNRNFNVTKLQVARLLKRGIILWWLLHTQLDVPPFSKNLEDGFLALPIE